MNNPDPLADIRDPDIHRVAADCIAHHRETIDALLSMTIRDRGEMRRTLDFLLRLPRPFSFIANPLARCLQRFAQNLLDNDTKNLIRGNQEAIATVIAKAHEL